jgi:hypothetical protein
MRVAEKCGPKDNRFPAQGRGRFKKQEKRRDYEAERTLFWTPIQGTVAGIASLCLFACDLVELGSIAVIPGWCTGILPIFPRAPKHIGIATRGIRTAPPTALRHSALARSASSIRHDSLEGARAIPVERYRGRADSDRPDHRRPTDRARSEPWRSHSIARCGEGFRPTSDCCFTKYESLFAGGKRPQRQSNCALPRARSRMQSFRFGSVHSSVNLT